MEDISKTIDEKKEELTGAYEKAKSKVKELDKSDSVA